MLLKVKMTIYLKPFDKLPPKVLPNVTFHTIWSRLCRGKNSEKETALFLNSLIKVCILIDIDKI